MGGFKRLGHIVFGLAGILCIAALALPWFGPFQNEATALMDNDYYYYGLQAVIAITSVGILFMLLRGLFAPRNIKTVVIGKEGGDSISVSTKAISSQTTHLIEADDRFVAERVRVHAKKHGKVKVDVRVRPRHTVNLSEEGKQLHDTLSGGLAAVCGDRVGRLNLEFVEAEQPEPAQDVVIERVNELEIPSSVYERAAQMEAASEATTRPLERPLASASPEATAIEPDAIEGE